jgi:hypothetical protein
MMPRAAFTVVIVAAVTVPGCGNSGETWDPRPRAELGETCTFHEDCIDKSGLVACLGTLADGLSCRAVERGKQGDAPCAVDIAPHQAVARDSLANEESPLVCFQKDGLTCDRATSSCELQARAGENCANRACEPTSVCEARACVPLQRVGEPCRDARLDRCVPDAYCDDANECQPKRGKGKPCDSGAACESLWCIDGRCG